MRTRPFRLPSHRQPGDAATVGNGQGHGDAAPARSDLPGETGGRGRRRLTGGPGARRPRVPAGSLGAAVGARPPGPGVKPAFFVFAITVLIFVGGSLALALGPRPVPSAQQVPVRTAPGAPLRATAAAPLLRPIELAGQPPANVLDALALPTGSRAVPGSATNRGVENYDRLMRFTVAAPQAQVVRFFQVELRADGWQQVSVGLPERGPGTEVLGQHGGSDGNTWELGIVVDPTTFGAGAGVAGTTPFSVELYIRNLTG